MDHKYIHHLLAKRLKYLLKRNRRHKMRILASVIKSKHLKTCRKNLR